MAKPQQTAATQIRKIDAKSILAREAHPIIDIARCQFRPSQHPLGFSLNLMA
jgi:hypothetical protein